MENLRKCREIQHFSPGPVLCPLSAWRKDPRGAAARSQPADLPAFALDPFGFRQVVGPMVSGQAVHRDLGAVVASSRDQNLERSERWAKNKVTTFQQLCIAFGFQIFGNSAQLADHR